MEHPCGTKAETQPNDNAVSSKRLAGPLVRFVGFYGLTGAALAILAGVVLLPAYARLQRVEHQRDCSHLRIREAEDTVAAQDRFKNRMVNDEVITRRLAWSKLGMYPCNEVVVLDPADAQKPPPGTLSQIRHENPAPPATWVQAAATKVTAPAYRRGLLVMAACMLVAALLMFAPPPKTAKQ
ncbi:MAG: hypothetical protein K8S55_09225 [Phycisphaerae bacterium]|nr:hypothetical protein [Phycisphaerae bacterium]